MEAGPITNMKKGWLYKTCYDEKNHEIAPMMMTQWWSRSSDDSDLVMMSLRWSRSSNDPDPVVMIQIELWSRSSDDVPMMIQIEWWSRSNDDDLDQVMIQIQDEDDLNMKMTWICRWRVDREKKTNADKLCRENTFLVKRECWCICNFGMYSLVYFMYCTPMFILGSICNVIKSCYALMFLSRGSIM